MYIQFAIGDPMLSRIINWIRSLTCNHQYAFQRVDVIMGYLVSEQICYKCRKKMYYIITDKEKR